MGNETVTLTPEELEKIKNIQNKYQDITFQLGQAKVQVLSALRREDKLTSQFDDLQKEENTMFEALNSKYGPGSFNLKSGEFTPAEATPTQAEVK